MIPVELNEVEAVLAEWVSGLLNLKNIDYAKNTSHTDAECTEPVCRSKEPAVQPQQLAKHPKRVQRL